MAQQPLKPGTPVKTTAFGKPTASAKPAAKVTDSRPVYFVFDKGNYRMLIISIAVVALGFILMSGKTDIYNTTKTVIAPLTVLAGFALGFFAIFKKPASI